MKKLFLFLGSLLLLAAAIGLSIFYESIVFLYIASAIPVFAVIVMPDIKSFQRLRKSGQGARVVAEESGGLIVVTFVPGYVNWGKKTLYIPSSPEEAVQKVDLGNADITMIIAASELRNHGSKKDRIGIDLGKVKQRAAAMDITANEINRFVLHRSDISAALGLATAPPSPSQSAEIGL